VQALISIFREVRDPRDLNARHDCASMLFVALMATLCGARNCVDIADFAAANEGILAEIVDLPHGAPSHDSFSRLFRLLDPDEMSRAFAALTAALREALGLGPVAGVIAVDGKRLRRGYERGGKFMPPLMISVWDAQTRLSIVARASPDGDEVKARLDALKSLVIKGCVVTADALRRHPKMAEGVRARGGHYALKLKGNNGPLHALAVAAFERADARGDGAFHEKSESGHDRFERRRWFITSPCPSTCRRDGCWRPSDCIGASKTTAIGRSMSSFMKTTPERERITPHKIFRSSAALLSIC
jgi:hypothetical protein